MGYGVFEKLAVEASHLTPGSLTNMMEFLPDSTIGLMEEFIDVSGARGTRSRDISREVIDKRRVGGGLRFIPTISETRILWPWMLGTAESGAGSSGSPWTYIVAETLIAKWCTVDRADNRFEYTNCCVDKASITCSKGGGLTYDLDLVGFDETVSATAFLASLVADTTSLGCFVFPNLVVTIGGTTYVIDDFKLHIDNAIDRDRFYNSPTLTAANPTDRVVSCSMRMPYSAATALYGLIGTSGTATIASTAVAMSAVWTNGLNVLTVNLPKVSWPRESPKPEGRGEIMVSVNLKAFSSGATKEINATLSNS